jgi:ribosome-binding factor A
VYFSLLDPEQDPRPTTEGLANAAGFLRGKLGKAIKVRHVPELRFVHDDSAEQAVRMGRLIDRTIEAQDSAGETANGNVDDQ